MDKETTLSEFEQLLIDFTRETQYVNGRLDGNFSGGYVKALVEFILKRQTMKVGDFTVQKLNDYVVKINYKSGEGGHFDLKDFEKAIHMFYQIYF